MGHKLTVIKKGKGGKWRGRILRIQYTYILLPQWVPRHIMQVCTQ